MRGLIPDYKLSTFEEASAEFLTEKGISAIILDIDNTLEPYEHPMPGDHVKKWISELQNVGIKIAFVSNNNKDRVELFNKDLGLVAFYKAGKPFKKNIIKAMNLIGAAASSTALMGDQIFTDVWAARNAKLTAILVSPINDKKDVFTRFKRFLERPILKKYDKKRAMK